MYAAGITRSLTSINLIASPTPSTIYSDSENSSGVISPKNFTFIPLVRSKPETVVNVFFPKISLMFSSVFSTMSNTLIIPLVLISVLLT